MEIFQLVGFGLIATVLIVLIRNQRPELAMQLGLAAGIIIFVLVVSRLKAVVDVLNDLANNAGVNSYYLSTVLKIVGIAYIAELGSQVCKDAGEGAIASKIELGAKILVIAAALPIIVAAVESVVRLIPS